jgi:two-component system response regulator HydG
MEKANQEMNKNVVGFDDEALKYLKDYHWPGNLRELKNVVFRVALISQTNKITADMILENIPEIKHYLKETKK